MLQAQQKRANSQFANRDIFGQAYGQNGQAGYGQKIAQMRALQSAYNTVNSMSGQYNVSSVQSASATEQLTKRIQANKFGYLDWAKNIRLVNANLTEQIALQNAASISWGRTAAGKTMTSILVPNGLQNKASGLGNTVRDLATKVGYYSSVVQSASRAGSEWGRGLQRTGFQITQGIGLPLAALGAVAAAAFYSVDKELVRIQKVYDVTYDKMLSDEENAINKTNELNQLRQKSMETARQVAQQYGQSITSTLNVEAELAATGQTGIELIKATSAVQRAATLGELSQQDAIKATIAIQGIRRQSAEELIETLNYVNAVENATSLSAQDWVESYAKIDPVMKVLGGSIQDTTTILVGFKENGISATEGANAFRTGITRMITPTKVAIATAEKFGVRIDDIGVQAGGQPIKMLELLSQRIQGLDNVQKTAVLGKLFGTQQLARMTALVDSFSNTEDGISQVARAMAVADQGAQQWSDTANNELKTATESASGRFKRMVESVRASLADIGPPFLEAGITILGVIDKIVNGFGKLPDGAKSAIIIGTVMTIVAGAVFLVVGAFVNLALTMAAAVAGGLKLVTNFRMLTPAQIAARQVTNSMTGALNTQAVATSNATSRLSAYIAAMRTAGAVQAGIAPMPTVTGPGVKTYGSTNIGAMSGPQFIQTPVGGVSQSTNTTHRNAAGGIVHNGSTYTTRQGKGGRTNYYQDGRKIDAPAYNRVSQALTTANTQSAQLVQNMKQASHNAAVGRANFVGVATALGSLAMLPTLISTLGDETASFSSKLTMALITLGLMAPTIGIVATRVKAISAVGMASGFRAGAMALGAMLGPVGLIAIAVAGVGLAIFGIVKKMNEWKKVSAEVNDSAKDWSEIMGYTLTTMEGIEDKQGKTTSSQVENANKLKDANKSLYKELKSVESAEQAVAIARREGFKVALTGGTQENVEEAMRTALNVAGINGTEQDAAVKLNMKVIVSNPEDLRNNLAKEMDTLLNDVIEEAAQKNRGWFGRTFGGGLSGDAKELASKTAGEFVAGFNNADGADKANMLKDFISSFNKQAEPEFKALQSKFESIFSTLDINNAGDLTKAMDDAAKYARGEKLTGDAAKYSKSQLAALVSLRAKVSADTVQLTATEELLAKTIAGNGDASADAAQDVSGLSDLWQKLKLTTTAGNDVNKAATAGFNELGESVDETGQAMDDTALKAADLNNALKESMSGTMDAVYDILAKRNEASQEAALDRIEASGEARLDRLEASNESKEEAFEARQKQSDEDFKNRKKQLDAQQKAEDKQFDSSWEARMEAHQEQYENEKKMVEDGAAAAIQAIDDQIAAEEKADEIRERIFQAQQARIQRMSEMFNNNIDFNAALSSGNLDEAARIQNNASATSLQWAADDTAAVAGSGSDAKKDALNGQKDALELEKQNRLDIMSEIEEAEQKQLQDRKDREKEELEARQTALQERLDAEQESWNNSLDQEKKRYDKSYEAQRKALQDQVDAQKKAAEAKFEAENLSIEQQIAAQKAMTPRTQEELNTQIANAQNTYETFGSTYVKPTAQEWGAEFGAAQTSAMATAANTLRDQVNWKEIGSNITDEMASAFNISGPQLLEWLKTGNYPGGAGATAATRNFSAGSSAGNNAGMFHTGGGPGWSSADRVGIPRSASLYPSETPAILKRGEFVMNERASRANAPLLAAMNAGQGVVRHSGGGIGAGLGAGALLGAAIAKTLAKSIAGTLQNTVMSSLGGFGTALAGKFAGVSLNGEQLKNATTIMNVGKSMGASNRDLAIALMTAMQESTLKNLNYGDRDSVGLFQQRTSQGWGSVAQIMDPSYAASKFFSELFKVKNRDQLSMNDAAQKVQRSGHPGAYAKWQDMAMAVLNGTPMMLMPSGGNMMNTGSFDGKFGKSAPTANGQGGMGPSALAARDFVRNTWGISNIGGYSNRNVAGTNKKSDHALGKAIDIMIKNYKNPEQVALGNQIAAWFVNNPGAFGTKYVIWNDKINTGTGMRSYSHPGGNTDNDTLQHRDHVHVSFFHQGGMAEMLQNAGVGLPQLKVGGNIKYDNTIANLHKGEAVLTAPLTKQLHEGINNMSVSGGGINITIPGMVIREDADIDRLANAIENKMASRQRRNGTGRVVR